MMKKKWKKVISAFLVTTFLFSMIGCSSGGDTATTDSSSDTSTEESNESASGGGSSGGTYKIGWAAKQITNDFDRDSLAAFTEVVEEAGGEITTTNADTDLAKHAENIESLLNSDIDGLVIHNGDMIQTEPLVAAAQEKGIPVVLINFASCIDGALTNVNGDNSMLSSLCANALLASIDYKGKIIYFHLAGDQVCETRLRMLEAMAEDYPDVEIEVINTEINSAKVQSQMEEILTANPDPGSIAAVGGAFDQLVSGAVESIKNAGRNEIKVGTIDGDMLSFQQMADPESPRVFTVAQDIPEIGRQAAYVLLDYLNGEKTEEDISKLTFVPCYLCTRANFVSTAEFRWGEEFWEKSGLDKSNIESTFDQTLEVTPVSSIAPE